MYIYIYTYKSSYSYHPQLGIGFTPSHIEFSGLLTFRIFRMHLGSHPQRKLDSTPKNRRLNKEQMWRNDGFTKICVETYWGYQSDLNII